MVWIHPCHLSRTIPYLPPPLPVATLPLHSPYHTIRQPARSTIQQTQSMELESTAMSASDTDAFSDDTLPTNRFALELEFLQALASPNYLHFLATSKTDEHMIQFPGDGTTNKSGSKTTGEQRLLLQDPAFRAFLQYLHRTWTRPEYARFVSYPHAFYFLELLIQGDNVDAAANIAKEWTLPAFRNFCHQQQYFAWQHRFAQLYGTGTTTTAPPTGTVVNAPAETTDAATSATS